MQAELLPCPFCGSSARYAGGTASGVYIVCGGPSPCGGKGPSRKNSSEAAHAWNRRPIPAPADRAKWEALREACNGLEDWLHEDDCKCGQCYRIKAITQALAALDAKEQG